MLSAIFMCLQVDELIFDKDMRIKNNYQYICTFWLVIDGFYFLRTYAALIVIDSTKIHKLSRSCICGYS
jgi:hypothetical protein